MIKEFLARAAVNPCMDSFCKSQWSAILIAWGAESGCNRVFGLLMGAMPQRGRTPWHIMRVADAEPIVRVGAQ